MSIENTIFYSAMGIIALAFSAKVGSIAYHHDFSGNWSMRLDDGKALSYDSGNYLLFKQPSLLYLSEFNPLDRVYVSTALVTKQGEHGLFLEALNPGYAQEALAYIDKVCPHFKAEEALRAAGPKQLTTLTLTGDNSSCISTQP